MGNIWRLGLPITIGHLVYALPMIFSMFWMGKLGSAAMASVGITRTLRYAMFSPIMGLSVGGGAVIARYIGAKDQEKANLAMFQSLVLFFLMIGGIGLVAFIFAGPLFRLLGTEEEILPLALSYARIIFAALPAIEILAIMGLLLNASGSPKRSLQANIIAAATTILLEPFLIFGLGPFPQLGIRGGAIALVLGSALGGGYFIFVLLTGRARVRLNLNSFRLHRRIMKSIITISLPAGVQRGTLSMVGAVLIRIVSIYGITAVAAYSVVARILGLIQLPCFGLGGTSATLVGQNLGAAKPWRAEKSAWLIAILTMGFMGLGVGILSFVAEQIISAFNAEAGVVSVGADMIRIVAIGQVFMGLSVVMESSLGGSGDTTSPMVINIIAFWLVQLLLAYSLSRIVGWGTNGIWLACTISYMVAAILMTLRFRRGRWKYKKI